MSGQVRGLMGWGRTFLPSLFTREKVPELLALAGAHQSQAARRARAEVLVRCCSEPWDSLERDMGRGASLQGSPQSIRQRENPCRSNTGTVTWASHTCAESHRRAGATHGHHPSGTMHGHCRAGATHGHRRAGATHSHHLAGTTQGHRRAGATHDCRLSEAQLCKRKGAEQAIQTTCCLSPHRPRPARKCSFQNNIWGSHPV